MGITQKDNFVMDSALLVNYKSQIIIQIPRHLGIWHIVLVLVKQVCIEWPEPAHKLLPGL